jgi:hypothetical protein
MSYHRSVTVAAVTVLLVAAQGAAHAQRRVTFSPGLAIGSAISRLERQPTSGSPWVKGGHAMLTLDVEARGIPLRFRGEAMAVGLNQSHGPMSVGASVVMPFGANRLRPYLLAGAGVYGVGGVRHPIGYTMGTGAEYRRSGTTIFVEGRLQSQTTNAISLGLRF